MSDDSYEVFRYPIQIKERHLDTFGHVNNAVYLEMFEEARWEFISERDYSLNEVKSFKKGPVVLEWNIKFKKELTLRDTITIESQTLSYQGKIGKLRQDIVDSEGHLICEGRMVFGLFDTVARKLVEPTPEWLYAIGVHKHLEKSS